MDMDMDMKMLNMACGTRYHKDWINIDFHANSKLVRKINILDVLPFEEDSFDVIYSSHFFEHISIIQAKSVLQEVHRILQPNGVLRIVVPDLENICKEYLKNLEEVSNDDKKDNKYDWIVIELLDQLVRMNRGGSMGKMFSSVSQSKDKELASYILHRTGDDLLNNNSPIQSRNITFSKIMNKSIYLYLKIIRFLVPKYLRDLVFINTSIGERHQWMYDRYSMTKLLNSLNFKNISVKSYNDSNIKNFNSYILDIKRDGSPYKGVSSLYIEATK